MKFHLLAIISAVLACYLLLSLVVIMCFWYVFMYILLITVLNNYTLFLSLSWVTELHFCAVAKVWHAINSTPIDEVLRLMFVRHKQTTQGPHMMEEQQVYRNKRKSRPHSTVVQAKLMAPLRSLWSRRFGPSFTQASVSACTEEDNRNVFKMSYIFTKLTFCLLITSIILLYINYMLFFFSASLASPYI